jgi:hypothetical protein
VSTIQTLFIVYFFQQCQDKGARLVEIESVEKNQLVIDLIINHELTYPNTTSNYFIGLRRFECWVWLSDTPICYSNWLPGEPSDLPTENEACGVMDFQGDLRAWNDLSCRDPTLGVCELL